MRQTHIFISPAELNRRQSLALPLWNNLRHLEEVPDDYWDGINAFISDPFASPLLLTRDHVGLHEMVNADGWKSISFLPYVKPAIRAAQIAATNENSFRFMEAFQALLNIRRLIISPDHEL